MEGDQPLFRENSGPDLYRYSLVSIYGGRVNVTLSTIIPDMICYPVGTVINHLA